MVWELVTNIDGCVSVFIGFSQINSTVQKSSTVGTEISQYFLADDVEGLERLIQIFYEVLVM